VIAALRSLADAAWFACLGLPLTAADERDARAYLRSLGYPCDLRVHLAASWQEAKAITSDPAWDQRWWREEQAQRQRLMDAARARLGETVLLERLTAATELAGQAIHGAAAIAADRDGLADAALVRAASGAATMALNEAALARLAGEGGDHLFVRKYALFESGRWPLGVVGDAFHLF
jgi:hypothetical protein